MLISILFACKPNEEKKIEDVDNSKELIKQEKKKVIDSLVKKYDIKYIWDSLRNEQFKYTIDFKPVISSKYQLISEYTIADIYEKDSSEFIILNIDNDPTLYFNLPISREQKIKFKEADDDTVSTGNLILIVSITDLKKRQLDINGKSIILVSSDSFIGKGEIIDIISIKNIKQHEKNKF